MSVFSFFPRVTGGATIIQESLGCGNSLAVEASFEIDSRRGLRHAGHRGYGLQHQLYTDHSGRNHVSCGFDNTFSAWSRGYGAGITRYVSSSDGHDL
jgi:hypothetical protein